MQFLHLLITTLFVQFIQCIDIGTWENVNIEQSIELNRRSILQKTKMTIKNVGDDGLLAYYIPVPSDLKGMISYQSAALSESLITLDCGINEEGDEVAVVFPSPIEPNQEVSILLIQNFNKLATLAKEYLEISEDQHLIVPVFDYPPSHYPTKLVSTTILGANDLQFITELNSDELSLLNVHETSVGLGPYFDLEANDSFEPKYVKYLYNTALTRVVKLEREVWVSHWANTVQFEENYDVINDGGKLSNGFSRAEWMNKRGAMLPKSALVVFDIEIPEQSSAHYYTDVVGMITTWKFLSNSNHLILKPRFPLFGGWMANFTIGWTNPLSQVSHALNSEIGEYLLEVPLVNGPINTIYDEIDLNIYLPEGAEIIKVYSPSVEAVVDQSFEKSYFDLKSGHLKTNIKISNVNDEFSYLKCYVHYQYTKKAFYTKPLSIAAYIFFGLLSFFIMKRVDFSIERKN